MKLKKFDCYQPKEACFPYYGDFELAINKQVDERVIFANDDFIVNYANPDYHPKNICAYDQSNLNQVEKNRELLFDQKKVHQVVDQQKLNQEIENRRETSNHCSVLHHVGKNIADTSFYRQRLDNLRSGTGDYDPEKLRETKKHLQQQYSGSSSRFADQKKKLPKPLQRKVKKQLFTREELINSLILNEDQMLLFCLDKDVPAIERKKRKVGGKTTEPLRGHSVLKKGLTDVRQDEATGFNKIQDQFFADHK